MAWTLEYNNLLSIIEIAHVGPTTGPDIRELLPKAIALMEKEGTLNVLIDATEMEPAPSIIDIYNQPAKQYVAEGLSRKTRIALVEPKSPKAKEAAQFYETVCVNRGRFVRLCSNRDEAIKWLTGTESSGSE